MREAITLAQSALKKISIEGKNSEALQIWSKEKDKFKWAKSVSDISKTLTHVLKNINEMKKAPAVKKTKVWSIRLKSQ